MHILVVDIGGTNVKIWKTGESDCEKITSGKKLTPGRLVERVKTVASDWQYDRVSIGYPGDVHNGRPTAEPLNLGSGWVAFDWTDVFGCPMRIMNDACMQALGSYEGGRMLYLGLGTGIGTAFIHDGRIIPLALGHLQFRDKTLNEYLCREGLKRFGNSIWREAVLEAGQVLRMAFQADYVVFGGGNAKKLDALPDGYRKGGNHNAYFGGLRMWEDSQHADTPRLAVVDQSAIEEPVFITLPAITSGIG